MYLKDKVTRITLRLNQEQFDFVKGSADTLGVSPSEFLRMVVNMTMLGAKRSDEIASKQVRAMVDEYMQQEGERRENEQTDSDHIV